MKQWPLHIAGTALTAVVVVAALHLYFDMQEAVQQVPPASMEAAVVPDFTLPDASGNDVVLSKVAARVRVVNFWASWSPYSRNELAALARLKHAYGSDIEVVALDRDKTPAEGRAFIASLDLGPGLIFVYDHDDTYYRKVGGYNMPETLFIDTDGSVLMHVHGPMSEESMQAELDQLLQ